MNESAEDPNPIDKTIRSQLAYDSAISHSYSQLPPDPQEIDPESAKTIRLLHDILGPQSSPDSHVPLRSDPLEWKLPTPFGRFDILEKLGQGSFGAVWKAYDPILKRLVAIKALHPELRLIAKLQERFEKEAQATARLNHPNIVRLYEVGSEHGINYIASEYVEGVPLRSFLNDQTFCSQEFSARLIAQLADAIHHSHLMGVLHRDIKPENVILQIPQTDQEMVGDRLPRLTDFGLARLIDQHPNEKYVSTVGLMIGSIDYMAPEQLMGDRESIGPSSDIYALAVMLFEILTGHLPRNPSGNIFQAIEMSLSPQDPRSLNPHIHRDLAAICMKCLAFSIQDRFQSASELRDELQCFLNGMPISTRPPTSVERFSRWTKSNRSLVTGIAMGLGSILLALGVSVSSAVLLAKRNEALIVAQEAIIESGKETKVQQALYRNLAWISAVKLAYGKLERGDLQGAYGDLGIIQQQHADATQRPEWQLLNAELQSQYQLMFKESFALKDTVAIPNTNLVALAGNEPTIRIVDRTTRETINRYKTSLRQIHALAVSSDGKYIAAGGSVKLGVERTYPTILDLSSGTMRELNVSGNSTIESLAFSPNGRMLAIGCRYEDILVADLENTERQPIQLPATRRARTLQWVSDKEVVVHTNTSELAIYHLDTSESKTIEFSKPIESFAVTPNARWVIATNFDYDGCTLVSLRDPTKQIRLNGLQRQAVCVATSPDDRWVAAGVESGDVSIWRLPEPSSDEQGFGSEFQEAPEIRRTLLGGGLNAISWSNNTVIAAGENGEAVAWSPFPQISPLNGESAVTSAAFLHPSKAVLGFENGQVLCVGIAEIRKSQFGNLTHLTSPCVEPIKDLEGTSGVSNLSLHNSTSLLVTYFNGEVRELQNEKNGTHHNLFSLPKNTSQLTAFLDWPIDMSQDGQWIAQCTRDNQIHFHNRLSQTQFSPIQLPNEIWATRFLGPKLLCVTGIFEGARIYDIESGERVATLGKVAAKAIYVNLPQGTVSIGFRDGYVRTWDMDSWQLIDSLRTSDSLIASICQTKDNSLGICIDDRSNIIAFSPKEKSVLGKIRDLNAVRNAKSFAIQTATLNPDGTKLLLLISYHLDNEITSYVHIYDLNSRDESPGQTTD
jgi:serine/threonine protein kinase/WD40 repeat protein